MSRPSISRRSLGGSSISSEGQPLVWLPSLSSSSEDQKNCRDDAIQALHRKAEALKQGGRDPTRMVRIAAVSRSHPVVPPYSAIAGRPATPAKFLGGTVEVGDMIEWLCQTQPHLTSAEEAWQFLSDVPTNDVGELTSVGSKEHEQGLCKPCAFWFKGACSYTIACRHCHRLHDGQKNKRLRPSKQRRQQLKDQMQNCDELSEDANSSAGEVPPGGGNAAAIAAPPSAASSSGVKLPEKGPLSL
mmetsp:Transcript_63141/g.150533  ORF Transcript_63141/g.150533 Transcript_63141/m.150533 type:complete len:244 (+) Transcript_63141:151-882(+)